LLASGADKISLNTAAINDPSIIGDGAREFGSQAVVIAIDARRRRDETETRGLGEGETVALSPSLRVSLSQHWEVYSHGGRTATGLDAVEWARRAEKLGAGEILLTSMDRDGTRDGYDIDLTAAISEAVSIPVIASGGAGSLEHLYEALNDGKASAVLAASIFHFGEFTIGQAKEYLRSRGLPLR
jgi:cyclase